VTATGTLETWADLLALEPRLATVDEALAKMRQTIRVSNQWQHYARAKHLLCHYVGWFAKQARPELQTSEAYEIGIDHICEVLGL
jgi:hypothetical protein